MDRNDSWRETKLYSNFALWGQEVAILHFDPRLDIFEAPGTQAPWLSDGVTLAFVQRPLMLIL